ncbi:uncharacterized protein LOC126092694, partial [Schistocerca cancellata]
LNFIGEAGKVLFGTLGEDLISAIVNAQKVLLEPRLINPVQIVPCTPA